MPSVWLPALSLEPRVVRAGDVPDGAGRLLLLIVAHADDPGFFVGGVVALWARAGWRIHCLRVTDDAKDSVGLTEAETIARNTTEFHAAAEHLGISSVEDLGWATDCLGDASRVDLRERMIHAIRRHRPYGLVTFDPYSVFQEDNLDHKVLAEAVDEAFWCAQFDKHHPEHMRDGLAPHGVFERWYFGRAVLGVTHVFDTASTLDTQIEAVACHRTMLENISRQIGLQAATAGMSPADVAGLEAEPYALADRILRDGSKAKGAPFGLSSAEHLRRARLRLDGAPPGAGGDL